MSPGVDAFTYHRVAGVWKRRGTGSTPVVTDPAEPTPEPTPTDRSNLVPGTYKPSASTTGVLDGVPLTPHNTGGADLIITTANQVFRNLDIYGNVIVRASGVQFINCRLRGGLNWPTYQTGVADCRHASARAVPALFEDCTIYAARPSYYRDGIMGNFTARRCDISNVTDGCGIYNTSSTDGAVTKVEASYIHDLVYWYPEPAHPNDGTHNDGIQIQSGGDIHIIGNFIDLTASLGDDRAYADPDGTAYSGGQLSGVNPEKPTQLTQPGGPHANGSGIIVQRNTGVALSNSVIVEQNWLKRGSTSLALQDGTYVVRNNIITRSSFYYYSGNPSNQYPIRPTSATTGAKVTGLYTTNRYEDNGEILTEANRGIRY